MPRLRFDLLKGRIYNGISGLRLSTELGTEAWFGGGARARREWSRDGVFARGCESARWDAREGGENPPLPRNCKRVFLRQVIEAQEWPNQSATGAVPASGRRFGLVLQVLIGRAARESGDRSRLPSLFS
jgi:hypothetical protein